VQNILLEPEHIRTLENLVEAARSLRKEDRAPFWAHPVATSHNLMIAHPGIAKDHPGFYPGDLRQLATEGLIRLNVHSSGSWEFDVTPLGYKYYKYVKAKVGTGTTAVEEETRRYLDASGIESRHPQALGKLREAYEHIWGDDAKSKMTLVGHLCREAQQFFAASLLARHPAHDAPPDPTKTVARVRAILATSAIQSPAVRATLDSLVSYWGAIADLAQRQEHGAQKEGEALVWEDARRLVFHTTFVMVELDRALR